MIDEAFDGVLGAAQAGAEWAWSLLYRRYSGPLLGYLRSRGAVEPEDLLGEVFLDVARSIGNFAGTEPAFRSWLFMIANNRVVDEHRRRRRRPFDATGGVPDTVVAADAEAEALRELGTQMVHAVLERLTDDQRNVLLLRILGDLTVDQTAAVLGKRPGAVKALQRRALAALGKIVEREGVTL